jgi:hypothetical protein
MIVNPIGLGGQWPGTAPQLAWVLLLQEMPGAAMNVVVKAAQSYSGVIDMPALLAQKPKKTFDWTKGSNKAPPTALSMHVTQDMYVGFILSDKMGVKFADQPFSGGAADAANFWFQPTRVSDTTAYLMVRGSMFNPAGCVHPFNIHLVATGTFADGTPYSTPIIIDPDGRLPDGGIPPQ